MRVTSLISVRPTLPSHARITDMYAGAAVPAKLYCDKANQPYRRLMERS